MRTRMWPSSCSGSVTVPTLPPPPRLCLLMLAVILLLHSPAPAHACPAEVCICKWKGGKQTVECGGQQLPNIPEGMDPGTQVLNFSGNSLQVLQSERFLRMDLLNLQKIYLSRNQLIRIHEKAFRGLSNLVELDLSDNALQHVPSETFQDYSSLMRLSLSGNPIRELKTSAFRHLSFLTTLELSNCQIERIENEAFVGMDNLEWLRLDGNRIAFIQGNHILPKSLHGVSLQSNRWTCDCRLLDMHSWLLSHNTPQAEEPRCVEPVRLKGQTIKSLQRDELACLPEVSPASTYTEVSEGRNVSIVCVVRAIPEPRVLWLFNGQVLTNDSFADNLRMYYYIDEGGGSGGEEKRSEIFIYNVAAEDNGTFSCVGQNVAGTAYSNYTLRVIIKEPPVVNEVSFPRDYMNYIVASSTGAGVIFVVLLCTIVLKCRQREPSKRKKCGAGGANGPNGGGTNADGSTGDGGLMKCASIINGDGDSLTGSAGLHLGEGLTPTKLGKENGLLIGGNGGAGGGAQLKQNLLLYAPASYQQQQQALDASAAHALQLHVSLASSNNGTPPPPLMVGGGLAYCSPPASLRNYQEKNPDLVNDAESVQHKLKSGGSLDAGADYDAASDCSGPCSIQGVSATPVQYDSCYQLAPQFSAPLMRPNGGGTRFTAMSTLPRGMQLKTVLSNVNAAAAAANVVPQHQVDVHLNPVCFLGTQDAFAYDYSNAHLQQPPPAHHHLQLQPQHSLGAATGAGAAQTQQNYYRTLPHNRAHKQQQFAAAAGNPSMRYSLEAELLQRSGTPTYDKYLAPHVRFNAEGYPQQAPLPPAQLVQYPSPPEGYKSNGSPVPTLDAGNPTMAFQQWPPCLPGYHAQPVRYSPTIVGVLSPQQPKAAPVQTQPLTSSCQTQTSSGNATSNNNKIAAGTTLAPNNATISAANSNAGSGEVKKRCAAAQADNSTIPECDENDASPTTSSSASASSSATVAAAAATPLNAETTKLRHLNGPLADSPDEGYVGDSHEGSDI